MSFFGVYPLLVSIYNGRSKTTFGESCAGADALGGGRGGFRRSKNSAGRCARKKK